MMRTPYNFLLTAFTIAITSLACQQSLSDGTTSTTQKGKGEDEKIDLPIADDLTKIIVRPAVNSQNLKAAIDSDLLKKMWPLVSVIDDSEPILKGWAFAPAYTGSFVAKKENYTFALYLGGIGRLQNSAGATQFFKYTLPKN